MFSRYVTQTHNVSLPLCQYFTDGTTNKLVGCYLETSPEDVVLVRVYGNKTELIVDRDNELKSFQVEQSLTVSQGVSAVSERVP